MRWPKYWSFSFSIIPSKEIPGLISFRMDWLDLLAVQGTLKSLLQHQSSKASIIWCSAFFTVHLSLSLGLSCSPWRAQLNAMIANYHPEAPIPTWAGSPARGFCSAVISTSAEWDPSTLRHHHLHPTLSLQQTESVLRAGTFSGTWGLLVSTYC